MQSLRVAKSARSKPVAQLLVIGGFPKHITSQESQLRPKQLILVLRALINLDALNCGRDQVFFTSRKAKRVSPNAVQSRSQIEMIIVQCAT